MALITKPNATTNGQVASGSEISANFDTIYNDHNGNITNANIAAAAAIADSKLAQIATYGKVSGASLTSLASISSAAGIIPADNVSTSVEVVTFLHDLATSGTTNVTTTFRAKVAFLYGTIQSGYPSFGADDGTTKRSITDVSAFVTNKWQYNNSGMYFAASSSDTIVGSVSSFAATNMVITWTTAGAAVVGTAYCGAIVIG
jgi:hypothetical protein